VLITVPDHCNRTCAQTVSI